MAHELLIGHLFIVQKTTKDDKRTFFNSFFHNSIKITLLLLSNKNHMKFASPFDWSLTASLEKEIEFAVKMFII
jgi:hypothetical protein